MTQDLLDAYQVVVDLMPDQFDSHDFIRKFMKQYTVKYAEVLLKFQNVQTSHGHIALNLKSHSKELGIMSNGRTNSMNVFNEVSECELWMKDK